MHSGYSPPTHRWLTRFEQAQSTTVTFALTSPQNGLALAPITAIGVANMEVVRFGQVDWNFNAVFTLLLSCFAGIGMSYYSFSLRCAGVCCSVPLAAGPPSLALPSLLSLLRLAR